MQAIFNYIKSIKKWNIYLGFRLEKTSLTGESDKKFKINKEYFNIFPNFSFEYKKSENHNFQLNLSRRIDRPNFSDLNPFMLFRDQYTIEYGNPFLLPSYANRGELSYNYRSFISTSVAYTYIQDAIIGYTVQNDSTKVTMSPIKNMKSSRRLEYSIFFQKTIMEKWDISIGGTLAYVGYKGDIDGVNFGRNGISYFGNISNSILISKNTKLEISGRYLGPNFYGVLQLKSRWLMSFAYKMSLCKDKLDVTLGVDDIFYTYIIRSSTNFGNQNWSYEQINDTRRFRVSINYKFGKMKIEKRNVNESNKEEKERFNH